MLITANEIGDQLYALCPQMNDWLPTVTEALTVEPDDVAGMISAYRKWCCAPGWIGKMWDCDKIAAAATVSIHRNRAMEVAKLPISERVLLAIGVVNGTRFEGEDKEHTVNFFCAWEGLHFFDMQTGRIWRGRRDEDQYFFARM